jgi:hypothetical protein
MQIPIKTLPKAVKKRLLALQKAPQNHDCHYSPLGPSGLAIIGMAIGLLAGLGLLYLWQFEYLHWQLAMLAGVIVGPIMLASMAYFWRRHRALLKPAVLVNPVYFARITLQELCFFNLWSELEDVKLTHHYREGEYFYSEFEFEFEGGKREQLAVGRKQKADSLARDFERARERMLAAAASDDFDALAKHDLFFEIRV